MGVFIYFLKNHFALPPALLILAKFGPEFTHFLLFMVKQNEWTIAAPGNSEKSHKKQHGNSGFYSVIILINIAIPVIINLLSRKGFVCFFGGVAFAV